MNPVILAAYGLLFLCLFTLLIIWVYERGMRAQIRKDKGLPPEPLKNPVEKLREAKETKKVQQEQTKIQQGLNNLLAYNGTPQEPEKGDR